MINIRLTSEDGYADLAQMLEPHGVTYAHCPINYSEPKVEDVDNLLGKLDVCPKPCLIFCQVGLRAAAMGVAFKTARGRASMALNGSLGSSGMDLIGEDDSKLLNGFCKEAEDSQLKIFVASYVASKVSNCAKRPDSSKICDNVYIAGQLSEDEIRYFVNAKGCKSVLNLRQPEEAGQFGLGMVAREKAIVEGMGLKYINVPVPREGNYDIELCSKVSQALQDLLSTASPVLVHCRTGELSLSSKRPCLYCERRLCAPEFLTSLCVLRAGGRVKQILTKSVEHGLFNESPCEPFVADVVSVDTTATGILVSGINMGGVVVDANQSMPQVSGSIAQMAYLHPLHFPQQPYSAPEPFIVAAQYHPDYKPVLAVTS